MSIAVNAPLQEAAERAFELLSRLVKVRSFFLTRATDDHITIEHVRNQKERLVDQGSELPLKQVF